MSDQRPSVGRIVHAVLASPYNGSDIAPAMVTRVWEQREDGSWSVNLTAFPDYSQHFLLMSSTRLFDTEEQAREHLPSFAAFWPPRV
jgi:hypothetical protein